MWNGRRASSSLPEKLAHPEAWSLGALLRIAGGIVLHMLVMRPALKPPQTRIHQKHSREDVTVTVVEVEKTDTKKEEEKVDHVLTQRCGGRSGT